MNLRPADEERHPIEARPRSAPRWNVAALVVPFVAFGGGCLIGEAYGGHPVSVAIVGLRGYGVISAAGVTCGLIALVRRERFWGVTALGLVVNGIGLLALIAFLESPWNRPRWSD